MLVKTRYAVRSRAGASMAKRQRGTKVSSTGEVRS